jgi:hypothetical protein
MTSFGLGFVLTLLIFSHTCFFTPKPSTHCMHDPGLNVPHIRPKVLTDNQMS